MALDFCIRDNHDQIIISIPVSLDAFYELIEKSKSKSGDFLIAEKLTDYYKDAEFYIDELPRFKKELENLRPDFVDFKEVVDLIYLLTELCDIASHLNKTISVLPD